MRSTSLLGVLVALGLGAIAAVLVYLSPADSAGFINHAGRQRMLSQRVSLESLAYFAQPTAARGAQLEHSLQTFSVTQRALLFGGEVPHLEGASQRRLRATDDAELLALLRDAARSWKTLESAIETGRDTAVRHFTARSEVYALDDALLTLIHETVHLMTTHSAPPAVISAIAQLGMLSQEVVKEALLYASDPTASLREKMQATADELSTTINLAQHGIAHLESAKVDGALLGVPTRLHSIQALWAVLRDVLTVVTATTDSLQSTRSIIVTQSDAVLKKMNVAVERAQTAAERTQLIFRSMIAALVVLVAGLVARSRRRAQAFLESTNAALEVRVTERTIELHAANERLKQLNHKLVDEQQRLIQAEKLSSVGMLAAGVAHEINNPLAGALSCITALREGRVAEHRTDTYFATVLDGLERIQRIVQGLLDYSRPSTGERSPVAADQLVLACEGLIIAGMNKRRIELCTPDDALEVYIVGDRNLLMQAVLNVLLNAVHASPDGGRIVVDYPVRSDMLGIRVKDSGAGFAPETIDNVTDPFFSTKPEGEGTGLGLAVTLGIVQSHGGELSFENDEGAVVTIWLQRSPNAPLEVAVAAPA